MRLVSRALVLAFLAGCGLHLEGTASLLEAGAPVASDADAPPVPEPDASAADSGLPPPPPPPPPGCECGLVPPQGWYLVAFATDRNTPCMGDLMAVDLGMDPVPKPENACGCGTCTFQLPGCQGTWNTLRGSSSTQCNSPGTARGSANGECQRFINASLSDYARLDPPAVGPASCTAPGVARADSATMTGVRLCSATSTSTTCLCAADRPAAYKTCIANTADVPCPANAPKRHLVARNATANCGAACGCNATATCSPVATFYSDDNCVNRVSTIVEGECRAHGASGADSMRYTVTPAGQCTTTPPAPSGASLVEPGTVCCPD